MKQFFEQYGGIALGILALLVLIAMITPVGNIIKTSLQRTVQTFSTRIDNQTDTMTESMKKNIENASSYFSIGDRITIANKSLIIIEQSTNNTYKVMELDNLVDSKWNQNKSDGDVYDGSYIDSYLNGTYYNSLPSEIKNAIVPTEITQKVFSTPTQNGNWTWSTKTDEEGTLLTWWVNIGTVEAPVWKRHNKVEPVSGQEGAFGLDSFLLKEERTGIVKNVFLPSADELNQIINLNDEKSVHDFFASTNYSSIWTRDVLQNCNTSIYLWNDSRSLDYPAGVGVAGIRGVRPVYTLDFTNLSVVKN